MVELDVVTVTSQAFSELSRVRFGGYAGAAVYWAINLFRGR
jgi:hypothetical protein